MQTISKVVFWASLILIFVFVIVPFVGHFTPLEFTNKDFKISFEQLRFLGLPLVILLTLFGTLKTNDPTGTKTSKIVLTISISLFSFFILFMTVFADMCRWTDNKILYKNIDDKSTKIILREFGCGATDSGSPIYKVCLIKNITPFLISVSSIDTLKIDKRAWQRVKDKY